MISASVAAPKIKVAVGLLNHSKPLERSSTLNRVAKLAANIGINTRKPEQALRANPTARLRKSLVIMKSK